VFAQDDVSDDDEHDEHGTSMCAIGDFEAWGKNSERGTDRGCT
jgi:hypothetical protein